MKKLAAIILAGIIIFYMPMFTRFTISNGKTGDIVFCDSIENFKDFYIYFKHSVNKTPVYEYFRIENNKFVVYKTTFYSYGAGMPDGTEGLGLNIKIENGQVQIDNINRKLDSFTVFVGTYADHTVHTDNESFMLKEYIEPQNPAVFRVRKVSIYNMVRRFLL